MSFLNNFYRDSQVSAVLGVVFISAGIFGMVPGVATMDTGIGV
jgi:hypothetical protein